MADEIEIKPGQVWERKKNGKRFVIVGPYKTYGESYDDWIWKGLDYKGRGVSYGSYIRRDSVLVAQSVEEVPDDVAHR